MTALQKSLVGAAIALTIGIGIQQVRDRSQRQDSQAITTHPSSREDRASANIRDSGGMEKKLATPAFFKPRLDEAGRRHLQQDPGGLLSDHDKTGWNRADDDLLVAWAGQDPAAALAWVNEGEHSAVREQLLAAVAAGILLHDGGEAMERFLAEHQQDPDIRPKNQGQLAQYLFYHLGREDTINAAMGILGKNNDSSLTGALIGGIDGAKNQTQAIDYMEAKGHPVAMDYWSFQEQIRSDPRFWADWASQRDSELLDDVLQSWTRRHPDQVREWIDRNIPQDDKRRKEIEEMYQLQTTPLDPVETITNEPDPESQEDEAGE